MTHRFLCWLHRNEGGLWHRTEAVLAAWARTQRLGGEHSHGGQQLARVSVQPLAGHQPPRGRGQGWALATGGQATVPAEVVVKVCGLEAHGDGVTAGVVIWLLGEGRARQPLRGGRGVGQRGQGLGGVWPGAGPRVTSPSEERSFIRTSL